MSRWFELGTKMQMALYFTDYVSEEAIIRPVLLWHMHYSCENKMYKWRFGHGYFYRYV